MNFPSPHRLTGDRKPDSMCARTLARSLSEDAQLRTGEIRVYTNLKTLVKRVFSIWVIDKPNSVVDDHLSMSSVTAGLKLPTKFGIAPSRSLPTRLLPVCRSCALTARFQPYLWSPKRPIGGMFSVALALSFARIQKS